MSLNTKEKSCGKEKNDYKQKRDKFLDNYNDFNCIANVAY